MDIGGVGIDLEADTPLDESLEMLLCTVDERRRLSQVEPYRRKMLRKVYFCAKEAFYKCQYETTRAMLNFTDVEIEICPESDEFVVKRIHKPGAQWLRFQQVVGMFRELDGCIVGTAVLPLTAVSVRDNS
jgi:4'-phosphopantetheinyl transferase EntD